MKKNKFFHLYNIDVPGESFMISEVRKDKYYMFNLNVELKKLNK